MNTSSILAMLLYTSILFALFMSSVETQGLIGLWRYTNDANYATPVHSFETFSTSSSVTQITTGNITSIYDFMQYTSSLVTPGEHYSWIQNANSTRDPTHPLLTLSVTGSSATITTGSYSVGTNPTTLAEFNSTHFITAQFNSGASRVYLGLTPKGNNVSTLIYTFPDTLLTTLPAGRSYSYYNPNNKLYIVYLWSRSSTSLLSVWRLNVTTTGGSPSVDLISRTNTSFSYDAYGSSGKWRRNGLAYLPSADQLWTAQTYYAKNVSFGIIHANGTHGIQFVYNSTVPAVNGWASVGGFTYSPSTGLFYAVLRVGLSSTYSCNVTVLSFNPTASNPASTITESGLVTSSALPASICAANRYNDVTIYRIFAQ